MAAKKQKSVKSPKPAKRQTKPKKRNKITLHHIEDAVLVILVLVLIAGVIAVLKNMNNTAEMPKPAELELITGQEYTD